MFSVRFALRVSVCASALRGSLYDSSVLRSGMPDSQDVLRTCLSASLSCSTRLPDSVSTCYPTGLSAYNASYSARRFDCKRYACNLSMSSEQRE